MREMIYCKEQAYELLQSGTIKGIRFFIVSFGTHPCAYIENIWGFTDYDDERLLSADAHGGFTFGGEREGVNCLGWDYAHYGDFTPNVPVLGGIKYTRKMVLEDVKQVIDQMIDLFGLENGNDKPGKV